MKIMFNNNSVSGVNRKYRGFVLDIPGQSSQTIDVPPQYVNDALSYLKYRHPAVICTPIVAEKPPEEPKPATEAVPVADQQQETAATEEEEASGSEEEQAGEPDPEPASTGDVAEPEKPATVETEAKAEEKSGKAAIAKGKAKEVKGTDKKKTQKTGGKK